MPHHFPLHTIKPQDVTTSGYRLRVTKSIFPELSGMSFYKLVLQPQAVREPHWHANADELGYCLQGTLLVSFYGNHNLRERFVVSEGEAFFIPSGALHVLENVGETTAEILLQFSHEEPEDFDLSSVFGMFSNAVLGNVWDVASDHFTNLKRNGNKTLLTDVNITSTIERSTNYRSAYWFGLEAGPDLLKNQGGDAKVARENVWPILKKQALYSLRITEQGMREPHWHPQTAEMGYVSKGKARMSIISPAGNVDTYVLEPGDLYFIPKAYPHHIENVGESLLHMLIFFDQSMPQDIGFTGSLKSFSDAILAKTVHCEEEVFASLPTYYEDLFIVNKKNPTD